MVSELMTSAVIGAIRADSPGKQVVSELMTSAVIGEGRADSPGKQTVVSELMTSAVIGAIGLTHQESRWSVN